jgi:HTH-type transcriptional regulator/antitoxin HigA
MYKLAIRDEETLDAGEQDYLDAISVFVSQFDQMHREIDEDATPLEILKYLLAENDLGVNDLGRIIGSQPAASMILSGKRQISKAHAKALAVRFAVDAGLFL